MATTETAYTNSAYLRVQTGMSATGEPKIGQMKLGRLADDTSKWNAEKALKISKAIASCLTVDYDSTRHTLVTQVQRTS